MNRILVLTDKESDLSLLLQKSCNATVMPLSTVCVDDTAFDALCVLVGNGEYPTNLSAPLHDCMDKMGRAGKPVFCEFVGPIGGVRLRGTTSYVRQRMAFNANNFAVEGLPQWALSECLYQDLRVPPSKRKRTEKPLLEECSYPRFSENSSQRTLPTTRNKS